MASRQFRRTPHTLRGPIRSSTQGPSGKVRMVASRPFRQTPHTSGGPIGSSTQCHRGRVRMVASRPFRRTPHTLAPYGAPPNDPMAGFPWWRSRLFRRTPSNVAWPHGVARCAWWRHAHLARPSYASWPHWECQRKWQGSQGGVTLISANSSYASWPHRDLHLRPHWQGSQGGVTTISAHPIAPFVAP